MIPLVAGFIARSALMQSPIGAFLKAIPRQLWIGLAIAALVLAAVLWHGRKVEAFASERYAAGYAAAKAEASEIQKRLERRNAELAAEIRRKSDAENRRIAAGADALRLSGPGRSRLACLPAGAGGHKAGGGDGDVAGPQMPADDRAAVPWGWLVGRAEEHDLNRAEVLAWREWHRRLTDEWAQWKAKAETARPEPR